MYEVLDVVGKERLLHLLQESDMPVLVKFGHEQCPPCRAVEPLLLKLAQDFGTELRIVEVDTRRAGNQELSELCPSGVPQFRLFLNADDRDEHLGFGDYARLRQWLVKAMRDLGRPVAEDTQKEHAFSAATSKMWSDFQAADPQARESAYKGYCAQLKKEVDDYLGLTPADDGTSHCQPLAVCRTGDRNCRS